MSFWKSGNCGRVIKPLGIGGAENRGAAFKGRMGLDVDGGKPRMLLIEVEGERSI